MSHDTHNPFSNETGEYLQELTEINKTPVKEPVEVEEKPKRPYNRRK
jgi:hypothetical protein